MKVQIVRTVEIETDVLVGIEDIQNAIAEAMQEATDCQSSFSIKQYISYCWSALNAITDDQIALVEDVNREHVASGMRRLAARFEPVNSRQPRPKPGREGG